MSGLHSASKGQQPPETEGASSRSPASLQTTPQGLLNVDKILKESAAHRNALLAATGHQSFVTLHPHSALNIPQDLLVEPNLEFSQSDFNTHYGDQQGMFIFTQNTFLPELGNKFYHQRDHNHGGEDRDKFLKERLTPMTQGGGHHPQRDHNNLKANNNNNNNHSQNHAAQSVIHPRYNNNTILNSSQTPSGLSRASQFVGGSGGNAMLSSAVYAGEGELLNEGGLVETPSAFNSFDSLLGNSSNSNGLRLPDLLDSSASLRLSPNAFDPSLSSPFDERHPLPIAIPLSETSPRDGGASVDSQMVSSSNLSSSNFSATEKLKAKAGGKGVPKTLSPGHAGVGGRVGAQPCPTCGKVFGNSSALTKHKLTHSDERKFVCQLCAKAFKRQDHLNGHMLTHRNKKPYECDVGGCGKSYCDARSLRRHKENHHNNNQPPSQHPLQQGKSAISTSGGPPTNALIPLQVGIPRINSLSLNSLQTAFAASAPREAVASVPQGNRIRYAPPIPQDGSSALSQLLGSILPSAATQLQFLAFQQAPPLPPPQQQQQQQRLTPQNTGTVENHLRETAGNDLEGKVLRDGGADSSPTNSSHAAPMDLTSVAPPSTTNTPASTIIAPLSNTQGSWLRFHTLMNEAFDESVERTKEASSSDNDDQLQLSSKMREKLSLKAVDERATVVEMETPSPYHQQSQASFHHQLAATNGSVSPVANDFSHHDYGSASSETIKRENAPSDGNDAFLVKEELEEKEAPLLQRLLTPDNSNQRVKEEMTPVSTPSQTSHEAPQNEDRLFASSDDWNGLSTTGFSNNTVSTAADQPQRDSSDKSVECALCQRKFKTVPALNGHMRLHGGYYKKTTADNKLSDKSLPSQQASLQTASVNVRALIEEKIIQKQMRQGNPVAHRPNEALGPSPDAEVKRPFTGEERSGTSDLPFISEESYTLSIPEEVTHHQENDPGGDCLLEGGLVEFRGETGDDSPFDAPPIEVETEMGGVEEQEEAPPTIEESANNAKIGTPNPFRHQFRVPRPVVEKHRRHSDSDHFAAAASKRPCNEAANNAVTSFLRRKVASRRTTRTGSDPTDFNQFFGSFLPDFDLDLVVDLSATLHGGGAPESESCPNTPLYSRTNATTDIFSSFPALGNDQQCHNTHFSFLERDLVLSSLDNPQQDSEFLVYANETTDQSMAVDNDGSAFQANDLMDNSYSSLCPSINALLDETPDQVTTANLVERVNSPAQPQTAVEMEIEVPIEAPKMEQLVEMEEMAQNRPKTPVVTETVKEGEIGTANGWNNLVDDAEDDVFLSPISVPASPVKPRVKHRPEPLFIPPHVNTGVFTSRLRSPRLRECSIEQKTLSPPPYTPPPMLSPVRNGPGLFWHILSASSGGNVTPKSAPITPNLLSNRISLSDEAPLLEDQVSDPPETDVLPHVNIGSQYQAQLPRCRERETRLSRVAEKADRLWHPAVTEGIPQEDVEAYLELACSACVVGGGRNKEYALHVLQLSGGDIREAALRLMQPEPRLAHGHPLLSYTYLETEKWLTEQTEAFHRALMKFDKDFFSISKELGSKSVKQCVEFYYEWKKMHAEEYKKLRVLRRKREQESLYYNLRPKSSNNNNNNNNEEEMDSPHLLDDSNNAKMSFALPSPAGSPGGRSASPASNTGENTVYPCKICGKIFPKVKSRSAHMKSHRQTEANKGGNHYQSNNYGGTPSFK